MQTTMTLLDWLAIGSALAVSVLLIRVLFACYAIDRRAHINRRLSEINYNAKREAALNHAKREDARYYNWR